MASGEINPDIERMILASPDSLEPYLVYADWLQERGDPLGELIALHHLMSSEPARRDADSERLAEVIDRHARYLLGPLHSLWEMEERDPMTVYPIEHGAFVILPVAHGDPLRRISLRFRMGFVDRAVVESYNTDVLCQLMSLSTFRFVQDISCHTRAEGIEALVEAMVPTQRTSLKTLFLSKGAVNATDAEALTRLNLNRITFFGTDGVDDDFLRTLFPHPTIRDLQLNRCAVTAAGLRDAVDKLEVLSIRQTSEPIDTEMCEVIGTARNLRELALEPYAADTEEGRRALSSLDLEGVYLTGLPELTPELAHWLGAFGSARVSGGGVEFFSVYALDQNVSADLTHALCGVESLPGFHIPFDSHVTLDDVRYILAHKKPRGLTFEGSSLASSALLEALEGNEHLEVLGIHGAPLLTTSDFEVLATLPALRALSLLDVPALTGEILHALRDLPLTHLQLPPLELSDDEWDALLAHSTFSELLVPATGLTDGRLLSLLQRNPDLTSIVLRGPSWLTPDVLRRLRTGRITTVYIHDFRMPRDVGLTLTTARISLHDFGDGERHFLSSSFRES